MSAEVRDAPREYTRSLARALAFVMLRILSVTLALALLPLPALADRAPPPPYKARATTKEMRTLELFIYEGDTYQRGRPPKNLRRKDVDAYLAAAIGDGGFNIETAQAIDNVASFYRTPQAATAALAKLTRSETTQADVTISIVLSRVALHGDAKQRAAVAQYWPWLCQKLETRMHVDELVRLFHRLDGAVTSDALKAAVDARIAALAPAVKQKDYSAEIETEYLRDTIRNALASVEYSLATQQTLAAQTDAAKRLASLIDIYLLIDEQTEYVAEWATGVLADTGTTTQGRARVAKAFRAALKRVAQQDAKRQEFAKLRALHGIQFFGGKLTKAEAAFVAKRQNSQSDWFGP